ncbi:T-lymphoma invasion and metastasis-inducing protein 1 [Myotis davidii]|uniref:T-lymphoma invasion and metastasis-inducing protein 1 n=1 Tax=Myotis davidii TaxID=225400 RepID=L5LQ10_MYODS|nr:T-lymphoma invasion and metastasis-inducing protein 1 [Myotis davidii]
MENEPILRPMGLTLLAALRGLLPPGRRVATGLIVWEPMPLQDSVQTGVCVVGRVRNPAPSPCAGHVRERPADQRAVSSGRHQGGNEGERRCTLLFYESDGRSGIEPGSVPKHAVWVENGIVQAVPEHPKKDFVFCLSNSLGDAFLFQTTSQTELENWITAIHSACSAAVARHHHKEDTLRLLKSEIKKLEQKIDMDEKMKKMGEMQLSAVTDSRKKKTILDQMHQLDPAAHYLRLRFLLENTLQVYVPQPEEDVYELLYQEIEICPKATRSLQVEKSDAAGDSYGFSLSSVEEDGVRRLYVSSVRDTGLAAKKGLKVGDEILEINNRVAATLSPAALRDFLSQPSLGLLVRTRPELEGGALLLGSPPHRADGPSEPGQSPLAFLPGSPGPGLGGAQGSGAEPAPEEAEGLDPESSDDTDLSSKDLNCLMERYLKPLQKETFLTPDELDVLFGNLTEMVEFQVEFLKTLEDGVRLVPDLEKLERVDQFKKVLFSLGGSFLYYADRFKLYSAFCASHTKVPKVLVKVAIKTMNKVASHINEMQKIHEEFGAVFDQLIAEQTGEKKEGRGGPGSTEQPQLISPPDGEEVGSRSTQPLSRTARLVSVLRGPLAVFKTAVVLVYKDGSKQKRKLVGSHRLSIYEEWDPFRFRHMIPTEALQVRALASADADASTACEIVHVKSESEGRPERVFHLCCGSPKSRKDFLKAVHSVLRDKHRRQLLKAESLPSSQQYVPFGGKRLCALKGARPAMSRAGTVGMRAAGTPPPPRHCRAEGAAILVGET